MLSYVMPVIKLGIMKFLVNAFMTESNGISIGPESLVIFFCLFPDVRMRMHSRRVRVLQ